MIRFLTIILSLYFYSLPNIYANKISQIGEIESGYVPIDVPFLSLDGTKHYLEEYDGKVILVVFWAGWCGSCSRHLEELDNLKKDFKKLPFEIIMVSEDFEGPEYVKALFAKYEIKHLTPYHDMHQKLFSAFGVNSLPCAFLINENGEKVLKFSDEVYWFDNELRKQIMSFISGSYPVPRNTYHKNTINFFRN